MNQKVAVIGAGLIGRSWAIVFARAGCSVSIYDVDLAEIDYAFAWIRQSLPNLANNDLLNGSSCQEVLARISPAHDIEEALADAVYVQECGPEQTHAKLSLFTKLGQLAMPDAILGSSTSGIQASEFSYAVPGRDRCLVVHPVNPPHLIPFVELVPAPWTRSDVIARTHEIMETIGQSPIMLTREQPGFVLNRLQGALLTEAFRLVEDGICDTDDVDTAVREGLGLRWSFMGPFETIDLNAPAGIADYCHRFGAMYYDMAKSQSAPKVWSPQLIRKIEKQRRNHLSASSLGTRQQWRDQRLAITVAEKHRLDKTLGL